MLYEAEGEKNDNYIVFVAEQSVLYWNEYIIQRVRVRGYHLLYEACVSEIAMNSGSDRDSDSDWDSDSNGDSGRDTDRDSENTDYVLVPSLQRLIHRALSASTDKRNDTLSTASQSYSHSHVHQQVIERTINSYMEIFISKIRFIHFYRYTWLVTSQHTRAVLDTFPYGGCLTSHDALSNDVPMVTYPAQFIRGRYTYQMYLQMNHTDLIAYNTSHYVQLVIQLLSNDTFYTLQKTLIHDKYTKGFHKNHLAAIEWLNVVTQLVLHKQEYYPIMHVT